MPKAHRHGDSRVCGASTVVQNQSTVFVNDKLWSVKGSLNSHGSGPLINSTGDTVFVEGIEVIVHGPDHSGADDICPISGPPHCDPMTATGSGDTFAY